MALLGSQGKWSQLRWGFEGVAAGTQAAALGYATRVKNLKMLPERPLVHSSNFSPRGPLKGRNHQTTLPLSFDTEPDVDSIARLQMHLRGYGAISTLAVGAYKFSIRDFEKGVDSMASIIDTISAEGDRDDGTAQLTIGAVLEKAKLKIEGGKLVNLSYDGMGQHFTHHGDAAAVVGPASWTGRLLLRGNVDPAITAQLRIKCSTAGALDGTAQVKCSTDGGSTYSTTEIAIVAGTWNRFIRSDGSNASAEATDPLEFMMTLGSGNLVAGGTPDEWSFANARVKGSPTYSTRIPLSGAGATYTIAGTVYHIQNCDMEIDVPKIPNFACGSRYPQGFLNDGVATTKITLSRKYTDRVLYNRILSGAVGTLEIKILGDYIAATGFRETWRHYFAQMQIDDAGSDPNNEKSMDEQIVIKPSFDGTNPMHLEEITCTLSALV